MIENTSSFYKLDLNGNNVIKNTLRLSRNYDNSYRLILYSKNNEIIVPKYYNFDVKNGITYFPNLENITES